MVASAQALGLTGITFTDHGEWTPGDNAVGFLDLDRYFAEIAEVRDRFAGTMAVLSGVELGNPHDYPEEAAAMLAGYPFDLVIGSVHWLDGQPGWSRRSLPKGWTPAIAATSRRSSGWSRWPTSTCWGTWTSCAATRGSSSTKVLTLDPYRDLIEQVLRNLIETGRGMEVNTSGLRKGLPEPVPGAPDPAVVPGAWEARSSFWAPMAIARSTWAMASTPRATWHGQPVSSA